MVETLEMPKGVMNVLILKALCWGPQHGYSVSRWIREISEGGFQVQEGVLYPALHRLEKRGLIAAQWGLSENNRRAKFYQLTRAGKAKLQQETLSWKRVANILFRVVAQNRPPSWMSMP